MFDNNLYRCQIKKNCVEDKELFSKLIQENEQWIYYID